MAKAATGMKEAAAELHTRLGDATPDAVLTACHEFWKTWGTLPSRPVDLAGLRRAALRQIRAQGRSQGTEVGFIARSLGLTPNRFSRLTSPKTVTS